MEQKILEAVKAALADGIQKHLGMFNGPLNTLIGDVVARHKDSLRELLDDAFRKALSIEELRDEIRTAYARKVAKVLIQGMEGEVEKRIKEFRHNPEFNARLVILVSDLVKSQK